MAKSSPHSDSLNGVFLFSLSFRLDFRFLRLANSVSCLYFSGFAPTTEFVDSSLNVAFLVGLFYPLLRFYSMSL